MNSPIKSGGLKELEFEGTLPCISGRVVCRLYIPEVKASYVGSTNQR